MYLVNFNFDFEGLEELIVSIGGKILLSIVVLIIGSLIIKRIVKLLRRRFDKLKFDKSLKNFLLSLISISLKVLLLISIASMLGVQMTSFIAIIGSIGLAVGLALQGSLSNFAGGVLILILKPFKSGDYIETKDHSGTVEEIQLFYTILTTPNNQRVIIPNAILSNSSTINYSVNPTRRLDIVFSVGYDSDIYKVKEILNKIAQDHPLILKEPEPQVVLGKHDASSLNFNFRVWTKREDYWKINYEILEQVKIEFDNAGINIPYPQMDVHVHKEDKVI